MNLLEAPSSRRHRAARLSSSSVRNRRLSTALALASVVVCSSGAHAAPAVLQRGYDAGVTGSNLTETVLTPANVTANTFGLNFTIPVDDNVYAQPLYVPNVTVPKHGKHNLLIVATMSDTVYAFDADVAILNFGSLILRPAWVPCPSRWRNSPSKTTATSSAILGC